MPPEARTDQVEHAIAVIHRLDGAPRRPAGLEGIGSLSQEPTIWRYTSGTADQVQPRRRMERAHEQANGDHSAQRRPVARTKSPSIGLPPKPVSRAKVGVAARNRHSVRPRPSRRPRHYARRRGLSGRDRGFGYPFASASGFRKAASPASDTSTHFESGKASAS